MSTNTNEGQQRSILVIDDIPSVIRMLQIQLTLDGYDVRGAEVDAAWEAIRAHEPDLILLEVILPGLSGYDLLQELKKERPHVPVVFLTTEHNEGDRALAFDLGADDYITKPFDPDELGKRIAELLNQPAAPRLLLRNEDLVIDFTRKLARRGDRLISLTANEWSILLALAAQSDTTVPAQELLLSIWGPNDKLGPERLQPLIEALRKSLELDPSQPVILIGTKEVGYLLKGPFSSEKR